MTEGIHRRCRLVCALLAFLCIHQRAWADQSTATIRVQILGPSTGMVVIEMSSSEEPWRRWSAQVDGIGAATVQGLPPSTYRVSVRFPAGTNGEMTVAVSASEIVSIEVTPASAMSGAATLQVVDRDRLGQGTDFRRQQLHDLPDASALPAILDATAPFVIADRIDSGGLGVAAPPRVGVRGASWTDLSVFLGELAAGQGPARGNVLTTDAAALEEIHVTSGLPSPEVAAPGAAIILVPRRPGATRRGAIDLSLTSPGMTSVNDRPGPPSIGRLNSWKNAGAQIGGPLRDRIGMFLSGSTSSIEREERGQPVSPDARLDTFNAHIVANPGDRNEVRGLVAFQNIDREFDGRSQFRDRNIGEHDTLWQSDLAWDVLSTSGSRREITIAYQRGTTTPRLGSVIGGTVDRVVDGTMPAPAADRTADRFQAGVLLEPREVQGRFGGNDIRIGLTFARTTWTAHVQAAPTVAELVDGLPARVWIPSVSDVESRRHTTDVAGYVADRLSLGHRLSVDVGLRAGHTSGSAEGAPGKVSWPAILPRVSFRWAPAALTVFGGYGRYQAELAPDVLAFGDPGEPSAQVYRWTDANRNGQFDPGESGLLIARAGRGQSVGSIDSALRAPTTDEFVLGAERRLSRTMTFEAIATIRRERSLLQSVNTGVPASSYRVIFVPDQGESYDGSSDDRPLALYDRLPSSFGQDHFTLTNPSGARASYDGLEFIWRLNSARWYSLAGATAFRTAGQGGNRGFRSTENDQGVIGELFENPNASTYAGGRLFFDRAYVLKWSTAYHAPYDILAAVTARYQDGQPFSRLVIAPDLAQGPEIVQAYLAGRTRFTFTATVDIRVVKGFQLGHTRASLRMDVFNVTNRADEVEEDAVTGPAFRLTTAAQPPRTIRAGLRFEF